MIRDERDKILEEYNLERFIDSNRSPSQIEYAIQKEHLEGPHPRAKAINNYAKRILNVIWNQESRNWDSYTPKQKPDKKASKKMKKESKNNTLSKEKIKKENSLENHSGITVDVILDIGTNSINKDDNLEEMQEETEELNKNKKRKQKENSSIDIPNSTLQKEQKKCNGHSTKNEEYDVKSLKTHKKKDEKINPSIESQTEVAIIDLDSLTPATFENELLLSKTTPLSLCLNRVVLDGSKYIYENYYNYSQKPSISDVISSMLIDWINSKVHIYKDTTSKSITKISVSGKFSKLCNINFSTIGRFELLNHYHSAGPNKQSIVPKIYLLQILSQLALEEYNLDFETNKSTVINKVLFEVIVSKLYDTNSNSDSPE